MAITGFTQDDFDVMEITGLEPRMNALKKRIRPKLEAIGEEMAPFLSEQTGETFYPHVAKHARRTVNPPDDTWVALGTGQRGYKSLPHFQVGLWSTHLFIQFGVIYEAENKTGYAEQLKQHIDDVWKAIPPYYYWSQDHMQADKTEQQALGKEGLLSWINRLASVKKAELLCGLQLTPGDPRVQSGEKLKATIEDVFKVLLPLYRLARQ
jgi:uncharacterized protein YktB (UPF0637 family)